MLVIDQSGSMKKKQTNSPKSAMDGVKALAKETVGMFYLNHAGLAARFSVVSFSETARILQPWSDTEGDIDAAIDAILPDGATSISAGFDLAFELLEGARADTDKVVLLLSDGEQSDAFAAPGKTPAQTAIDAAQRVKNVNTFGAKVFAFGFGPSVSVGTLAST